MKKYVIAVCIGTMMVLSTNAQTKRPPIRIPEIDASITVQAGTKYFKAKHTAKAWLTITPGKGLTLNFETDANVTVAKLESTDKPPFHDGSGTTQSTNFSTPVKKYFFYLDSPAYKGHKAYSLNLITPDVQADAGMYWSCLVVRK
jgi:hypothetical protein